MSQHSLYAWKRQFAQRPEEGSKDVEIRQLKRELLRVTEERDILKKPPRISPGMQSEIRVRYRASHAVFGARNVRVSAHPAQRLLRLVEEPAEQTAKEDVRQTQLIRHAWEESGKVYGYRKLHDDLLDQGETCCPNRVARLASLAGIEARIGYKRRPGSYGGKPSGVVDITYIRTQEGFAYLAVVIDLYSRRVVGWSMQNRQTTDLVLQALLMAVWRRKPKSTVLIHSDQGSQFASMEWASFLKAHNLEHSMSRRGNCHDNAVVESFFNLLKRERIRRRAYRSRDEARQGVFDYIEMFYNPIRKHVRNGMLSPVEFERQQMMSTEGV